MPLALPLLPAASCTALAPAVLNHFHECHGGRISISRTLPGFMTWVDPLKEVWFLNTTAFTWNAISEQFRAVLWVEG